MPYQPKHQRPAPTPEELALRAKNKKLARKVVIILLSMCVLLIGLNFLAELDFTPLFQAIFGTNDETPDIRFEYPDFEEDILKDPVYLDKQRLMAFKYGGQMTLINEDDYDQYDPAINLMHTYFQAAIHGWLETYNECFSDAYHEANDGEREEDFTMQRIYDMEIELLGQIKDPANSDLNRSYFRVEYKIQKNNGTFRDDMGSDCSLAQVFEIVWHPIEKTAHIDAICYYGKFEGVPQIKEP